MPSCWNRLKKDEWLGCMIQGRSLVSPFSGARVLAFRALQMRFRSLERDRTHSCVRRYGDVHNMVIVHTGVWLDRSDDLMSGAACVRVPARHHGIRQTGIRKCAKGSILFGRYPRRGRYGCGENAVLPPTRQGVSGATGAAGGSGSRQAREIIDPVGNSARGHQWFSGRFCMGR